MTLWFGPLLNVILLLGGQLLFVTLLFGYRTKCNNILTQLYCNNITVMTTNAKTCTKCNTVVQDNICGTKCNNNDWSYPSNGAKYGTTVATVLLIWFYPGNGAKCCTIVVTVLLLWSYPGNGTKWESR